MRNPKLFISYSWSDADHETWVLNLATELRESGVDAILDKWHLGAGDDAVVFMEKMVADPEIKKVLIVCDKEYADKADNRVGGVGTEAQIISPELYGGQSNEKFVAVVREKDESGKAYLPIYYRSRIYIDLSQDERYADEFERLLRWIYDKPVHIKPEVGTPPSFLQESARISLGTTTQFRRCLEGLRNHRVYASGAVSEYCKTFALNLERFRISQPDGEFDDAVIKSVKEFVPCRNEAIQLFAAIAQYAPGEEFARIIHRFFESLAPYMERPASISGWRETDFDNYRFLIHELFLYALAVFLKYERFEQANYLLQQQYYLPLQ